MGMEGPASLHGHTCVAIAAVLGGFAGGWCHQCRHSLLRVLCIVPHLPLLGVDYNSCESGPHASSAKV